MLGRGRFPALLAALALLSACGEAPEPPSSPPSPALWEVSGPEGAHGWLFGTVHRLPDGYDWRTRALDAAFAGADTLVVEADSVGLDPNLYYRIAITPGLGTPSSRADPAQREQLAGAFAHAGLSENDFRSTETWAVATSLATALSFGESENGVDIALLKQRGTKRLVELEGYAGQLRIFDGLPAQEQLDFLQIVAANVETAAAESKQQTDAWRSGDTATIEAAMREGLLADPELRAALLTGRNRAWVVKLEPLLREGGDIFVAVGAAHLLGEDSLPALLTARGYTVKRVQ